MDIWTTRTILYIIDFYYAIIIIIYLCYDIVINIVLVDCYRYCDQPIDSTDGLEQACTVAVYRRVCIGAKDP